jgi:hypothetical protein
MAIQSAADWKKKRAEQNQAIISSTPVASPSATPDQGGGGANLGDFMSQKLSFLQEPGQFKDASAIPDWKTGFGPLDWAANNLVNPIIKPLEQFGRIVPGVAFEGARAIDATMNGPEKMYQGENPFVPGMESSSQGDNAKMIALRTGKAMLDLITLGKGGALAKGGKGLLKKAGEGFLMGAAFPATQREAPTVGQEAVSAGAGTILAPVAGVAMNKAGEMARRLLGKAPQEVIGDIHSQAVANTALIKTPTPFELAEQRLQQRQWETQGTPFNPPAGTQFNPQGAMEIPPGGFQSFEPSGSQPLREPMGGVGMDDNTFAGDLLNSVLGKKKALQIQKQVIESRVGEPFPEPGKILVQPVGQRPPPVLGQYKIERPYFNDMPKEVQSVATAINPNVPDVVPAHVPESITTIPIEQRTPSKLQVLGRNLWQPVQSAVSNMGKSGQALSKAIDDFRASEYTMRGKNQLNIDNAFGKLKLTPEEELNFWEAAQHLAAPLNEKVQAAVGKSREFANQFFKENTNRGILDNMVDNSGSPIIDPNSYLSHMYNDKGWQDYEFNSNKFFDKIAKHNLKPGDDIAKVTAEVVADWKYIQKNMTPKSFFERQRTWRIPPEYMEHNPQKIWTRYNASASKRYALLDHFGAPIEEGDEMGNRVLSYPQIKQHLGNIQAENGLDSMRYAQNAMDLIVGRHPSDFAMKKVVSDLMEFQLVSKLTPLTTIPNMQQGFLASIYRHGLKYAVQGLKDAFTQEGKDFVHKTGLVGEGFYQPTKNSAAVKVWSQITQFPYSEDFNFRINTNSAKHFIQDMYTKLVENPNDKIVQKQLQLHGLDPQKLLAQGSLTEDDLLKGAYISGRDSIFPKLAEQVPMWANNPTGKLIYQFSHYALKQPEMLMSQFKVSKTRGATSLLKFLAAQAVLGEPVADIWSLIRGKDRPQDLPSRVMENIFNAGALGVPAEIYQTLASGYSGVAGPFAGPTISGLAQTGSRIIQDLNSGAPGKALEDTIRGRIKGDIPFPGPPVPAGAFLERLVPREKLPSGGGGGRGSYSGATIQ